MCHTRDSEKDNLPSSCTRNTYSLDRSNDQLKEEDKEKDHEVERAVIPENKLKQLIYLHTLLNTCNVKRYYRHT